MSGRTCSLLTALCLPALLSATCNPKKTGPSADSSAAAERADAQPEAPAADEKQAAPECPATAASAPPRGAVVGPACPPSAAGADPTLAGEIEERAGELAAGLAPAGSAFGGKVSGDPIVLGRAVLQGPPHCYVIVALCAGGAEALVRVAASESQDVEEGSGPSLRVCPEASGPHSIALSAGEGEHVCAARLYGD